MRDLGEQLRTYLDEVATPVAPSEVQRDAPASIPWRGRRPVLAALAVAACLAVVAVAVAVSRRGSSDRGVATGPIPATGAWPTPFGEEVAAPHVPDGWKPVDVGSLRFAVPNDWAVPLPSACQFGSAPGVVMVVEGAPQPATRVGPAGGADGGCTMAGPNLPEVVTVSLGAPTDGTASATGRPVRVGTLSARELDITSLTVPGAPGCGSACPRTFRFDDGQVLSIAGPHERAVLATMTDAGGRRALQGGATADVAGWSSIHFRGIRFEVPPTWSPVALDATTSTLLPDGTTASGYPIAPGQCGGPLFPAGRGPRAYVGAAQLAISCPPPFRLDLTPRAGAWIRPSSDEEVAQIGPVIATGMSGAVEISAIRVIHDPDPAPALELVLRHAGEVLRLSIGVPADASVARAIVRSIAAG